MRCLRLARFFDSPILFLSILSISLFNCHPIHCASPYRRASSSHPPGLGSGISNRRKSAWLAQASFLCLLLLHVLSVDPSLSGICYVNKLTQCPTLLMRTKSHDRIFPTLKLSRLRDWFHYLLCKSQWNPFWSLQGMYQLFFFFFFLDAPFFFPTSNFFFLFFS